jgi:5-methyltetrahydrofolate--homocysteine methyltransferase
VNLYELLERERVVLADGGMGTMLQSIGLEAGEVPELWNVERPDDIEGILDAYAAAGAHYITTNTFGGSAPRLAMHGLDDRVRELNAAGASLARRVADRHGILVAGDVGPTGELLAPLGTMEPEEAEDVFAAQIAGLVDGGIDFVLIETMSDLAEAEAAVRAAQRSAPDLPVAVTMSFDTHGRTMFGVTPAHAVERLATLGVRAIGGNCGRGPEQMQDVLREMQDARPDGVFLMAVSNAGLPHPVGDHFEYDGTPEIMAAHARELLGLGANVIGACCGSTPEHIAAMRDALAATAGNG